MIFIGLPIYRATSQEAYADLPGPVAVSLAVGRAVMGPHMLQRMQEGIIDRQRAELVGVFLDTPAATHLFFWDSDVAIPGAGVKALVDAARSGARLVAIPQTRRGAPGQFSVEGYDPSTETAARCGFGAIVIARPVFERVRDAHPDLVCRSAIDPARRICAMFLPVIVDGDMLSEDYSFLHRAGERVRLLVDHEVEHAGLRGKFPG